MMFNCILVLALAAFTASATLVSTNGFNNLNGGYRASVSDVCRCVKTVVRPQIRSEITSIPTLQHFVRTETTPVIERIPYSVNRRLDTPNYSQTTGTGFVSGVFPAGGVYTGMNGGVLRNNFISIPGGSVLNNGGYVNGGFGGFSNALC